MPRGPQSRFQRTEAVSLVDADTGQLTRPRYNDLVPRLTEVDPTDRFIRVSDGDSWATLSLATLGDANGWWAIADLSDVVDPFAELATGEPLRVPSQIRYVFDLLPGGGSR